MWREATLWSSVPTNCTWLFFAWQLAKQADHLECRFGTLGPFVSNRSPGSINGLFERVASQYAHQHGQAAVETNPPEAQADVTVDVLIVRRFAANDRSQADDGGVTFCLCQSISNQWDLPSTRNPSHVDRIVRDVVGA